MCARDKQILNSVTSILFTVWITYNQEEFTLNITNVNTSQRMLKLPSLLFS